MTNTLHRFGDADSFHDDYIVFAIASRGKNDEGALEKLQRFLRMAIPFGPVNLGDARNGGSLRPCKNMQPTSHVLLLSTMCGHGMVANSLAKKMIDWVKEGRRTPDQAVTYLQRFCSCGVFNPSRAKRILEDARVSTK